jgi:hypothetical protein
MTRTIVDSSELKRLMTEELQAMEDDYKDCQFGGIMKLQEPDEHGCNWSLPMIRCSGIPAAVCEAAAAIVTKDFQAKYNIE